MLAPKYLSLGTRISPKESRSTRASPFEVESLFCDIEMLLTLATRGTEDVMENNAGLDYQAIRENKISGSQ